MEDDQPKFNKANRRIYTFLKRPDCDLEPQAQAILNAVERHTPVNRFELIKTLARVLETKSTVSKVLSYHQRLLVRLGCIQVESPSEHRARIEQERRTKIMRAKAVRNRMGGWGISTDGEEPVGHYPTEIDAIRIIELNHFDKEPSETTIPGGGSRQ
jgi:hypothetical protein